MSKTPPQRRTLPRVLIPMALLALSAAGSVQAAVTKATAATVTPAAPAPTNSIVSVTAVLKPGLPAYYDICLYSSAGFPMNDTAPTLSIGPNTFLISRYVSGRPLDEIIFSLTHTQFAALKNGEPVAVYYNSDDAGNTALEQTFGPFESVYFPYYKAPVSAH
jgi:hypothetical protein